MVSIHTFLILWFISFLPFYLLLLQMYDVSPYMINVKHYYFANVMFQ